MTAAAAITCLVRCSVIIEPFAEMPVGGWPADVSIKTLTPGKHNCCEWEM